MPSLDNQKFDRYLGSIKYLTACCLVLLLSFNSNAQGLEIGVGFGATNYTGDLQRGYDILNNRPAGQGLIRYNLSNVVSVRATGLVGILEGSDVSRPNDLFSEQRRRVFKRVVLEASTVVEYNFLDYKNRYSLIKWSPYFYGGFGLTAYTDKTDTDYKRIQPVIPFGLGVKYLLTKNLSLEYEIGARKTFFDHLDEVSEFPGLRNDYGNPNSNDWYYFTGFSITYTFFSIPCPYSYQ